MHAICGHVQLGMVNSEPVQGELWGGVWSVERTLPSAGSRALWEAKHIRLGGRAALKLLAAADRSTRCICQVHSPNVVQVLDRGVHAGRGYLAMELLQGEDLARMLLREQRLRLAEACHLVDQVARGLSCMHAAGFIHADLSPGHIFMIHEGDGGFFVKLLDFDAAERAARARHDVNALTCMSPEQLDGGALDARSDVWSLGALAYQVLTGVPPFLEPTYDETISRIRAGTCAPVAKHRAELPSELDAIFARAFRVHRAERFASVRELSDAFIHVSAANSSSVRKRVELGVTERAPTQSPLSATRAAIARFVSTRRALALALITALLGGLLGAWTMRTLLTRPKHPPATRVPSPAVAVPSPPPLEAPLRAAPLPAPESTPPSASTIEVESGKPSAVEGPARVRRRVAADNVSSPRVGKDWGF